ncbi:MAG TPA: tetratricopeptide repeat protein [Phycisphaerae bacterium]|nr:tetratricopeptide repeat protein [Phycisphaerae bacterium]
MSRTIPAILAFAVVAGLAGVIGYSVAHNSRISESERRQQEVDQKLAELQRLTQSLQQYETAPSTPFPTVAVLPSATAPGATTAPGALPNLDKERESSTITAEGFRLLATRDPKDALKAAALFREGIDRVDDRNPDFYHGLGRALIATRQYPEAVKVFEQGRRIDPSSAQIASGLGWAYFDTHDYYDAKRAWEASIALDPNYLDPWSAMAWVYLALGERDKSVKGFQVLVDSGAQRNDWIFGLGMARASNTHLDQIRSQFPGMPDPKLFLTPPASAPASRP